MLAPFVNILATQGHTQPILLYCCTGVTIPKGCINVVKFFIYTACEVKIPVSGNYVYKNDM